MINFCTRYKEGVENFSSISVRDYQAVVNPHKIDSGLISRVLKEGKNQINRSGWALQDKGIFVKKLGVEEIECFPPARFVNNVILSYRSFLPWVCVPEVFGLIYGGSFLDLVRRTKEAYVLNSYFNGTTFSSLIESMSKEELESSFRQIGCVLDNFRKDNIYLMDFAPRDIVFVAQGTRKSPTFVDMEHVKCGSFRNDEKLLKEQIKQFNSDYRLFLKPKTLKMMRNYVFPQAVKSSPQ